MAGKANMIKLRVVDTATFIQAGKRVNGELYDYSKSVFVGWRKPILIGCNRCGKLINLKNAGSHYIKGCGCKACNHDRLSPCRVCGVDVSSKVYHAQAKRCRACCDKAKQDRVAHKESKHGKNCKWCGVWFVDRDRFYCTVECRKSAVAKPVEFCCAYCGAHGFKDPHSIKNPSRIFCGPECQNQFQATRYWDYQSKGQRINWMPSNCKAAKKRWLARRAAYKADKPKGKWFAKCMAETRGLPRPSSGWEKRCDAAIRSIAGRVLGDFRLRSVKITGSWERRVQLEQPRLYQKGRTKWKQRCETATRNMRRREAIKNNGRQQLIN